MELTEGPIYVFWSVRYVFVVDWVRSRQVASINLGAYPLTRDPTADEISKAVKLVIKTTDQINLSRVVSLNMAVTALQSCNQSMTPDWCHIGFENVTGKLILQGRCTIDYNANKCKEATVDLANGNLIYCGEVPCRIN